MSGDKKSNVVDPKDLLELQYLKHFIVGQPEVKAVFPALHGEPEIAPQPAYLSMTYLRQSLSRVHSLLLQKGGQPMFEGELWEADQHDCLMAFEDSANPDKNSLAQRTARWLLAPAQIAIFAAGQVEMQLEGRRRKQPRPPQVCARNQKLFYRLMDELMTLGDANLPSVMNIKAREKHVMAFLYREYYEVLRLVRYVIKHVEHTQTLRAESRLFEAHIAATEMSSTAERLESGDFTHKARVAVPLQAVLDKKLEAMKQALEAKLLSKDGVYTGSGESIVARVEFRDFRQHIVAFADKVSDILAKEALVRYKQGQRGAQLTPDQIYNTLTPEVAAKVDHAIKQVMWELTCCCYVTFKGENEAPVRAADRTHTKTDNECFNNARNAFDAELRDWLKAANGGLKAELDSHLYSNAIDAVKIKQPALANVKFMPDATKPDVNLAGWLDMERDLQGLLVTWKETADEEQQAVYTNIVTQSLEKNAPAQAAFLDYLQESEQALQDLKIQLAPDPDALLVAAPAEGIAVADAALGQIAGLKKKYNAPHAELYFHHQDSLAKGQDALETILIDTMGKLGKEVVGALENAKDTTGLVNANAALGAQLVLTSKLTEVSVGDAAKSALQQVCADVFSLYQSYKVVGFFGRAHKEACLTVSEKTFAQVEATLSKATSLAADPRHQLLMDFFNPNNPNGFQKELREAYADNSKRNAIARFFKPQSRTVTLLHSIVEKIEASKLLPEADVAITLLDADQRETLQQAVEEQVRQSIPRSGVRFGR